LFSCHTPTPALRKRISRMTAGSTKAAKPVCVCVCACVCVCVCVCVCGCVWVCVCCYGTLILVLLVRGDEEGEAYKGITRVSQKFYKSV
jgi:hypothetical protein